MFKKKNTKTASQSEKALKKKPVVKKGKTQPGKAGTKVGKVQAGKTPVQSGKPQDSSDAVLAKLKAIEREMSLEEARDRVDQLEDEKIAANIEQLLKILKSGE